MAEEKRPCTSRTVFIQPSTGGQIEVKVPAESSVTCLKKAVANRLKVPRDRIVLLHKNRQLVEGTLEDNRVMDGAKLTLLPSVETGLVSQRPEQCVMQALETLNETQVDNFLAGRAPLNLTMRLGDHMMFIQLQLSTVDQAASNRSSGSSGLAPTDPSSQLPTPPTTPTTPDSPNTTLRFPNPSAAPLSPPPSPKMTTPHSAENEAGPPKLNARALAEASRNLTHTLRQLSSVALNKKMNESCDGRCCTAREQGGAVIESMFHHGRGVYSGTFSGTLSPSLQDKDGRPRRDISTIIHILNDLLGASAHCRPTSQCLCPTASSSSAATSSASSHHVHNSTTLQVKVDGQKKQEENKVLRQKMEHIQSMLEERRQRRKARRNLRSSPYPKNSAKSSPHGDSSNPESTTAIHSTEHGDQNMTECASGTAVA